MSYTPGPWQRKGRTVYALTEDKKGRIVNRFDAQISPGGSISMYDSEETQLANARLIAAAPELLEALETLYGKLVMSSRDGSSRITEEDGQMAEQAIMKARGT